MYNLPKKEKTITVEPEGFDGVKLVFETIGPEEAFEIMDDLGFSVEDFRGDGLELEMRPRMAGPMLRFAREQLTGAEGLSIGGEPFDASDEEHVSSIPMEMLTAGFSELVQYPFLGNGAGKDSKEQAEPSPKDSTPQEA